MPARARYSAWCCAAAVTRSSVRTAGAATAARSSLWTRNMSAASFDRGTLVEAGVALGDPVASGVAETATAVRADVAEGVDRSVRAKSADGCGLARNPARAIPAASATTSANGPRVNKAPLRISHLFSESTDSRGSNDTQRRTQRHIPV